MKKQKEILDMVGELELERRGWIVNDHWEADRCAIGLSNIHRPGRLAYISTFDLPANRYYCEIELEDFDVGSRTGQKAPPARDGLSLEELKNFLIQHLGSNGSSSFA